MNPRPVSSRQRDTPSGLRSMRAPSASSTSALPQREVADRLPCLATATPAPATTNVDVVEMLNVERPPPVPQVSMNGPSGRRDRLGVRAHGGRQAGELLGRLPLRAQGHEEAGGLHVAGLAGHDRVEGLRGAVAAEVLTGEQPVDGVGQDLRGHERTAYADRLRKLPSRALPSPVRIDSGWNWTPSTGRCRWRRPITTSPSHQAVTSRSARAVGVDHQRVVAGRRHRGRQAGEDRAPVVRDLARLAVHRLAPAHHPAAERLADRLVAEADAEDRHRARPARGWRRPRCPPRPASSGRARPRGGSAAGRATPATSIASWRCTITSAPSSPRYWTRL